MAKNGDQFRILGLSATPGNNVEVKHPCSRFYSIFLTRVGLGRTKCHPKLADLSH